LTIVRVVTYDSGGKFGLSRLEREKGVRHGDG